jgi:L-rhamnose mutarotase
VRERVCFTLQIRPEMLSQYLRAHEVVWPEMIQALEESGWRNYTLFYRERDALVVGYLETEDFQAALAAMAERDVNTRWQASMAKYFAIPAKDSPDQSLTRLTEYFHVA